MDSDASSYQARRVFELIEPIATVAYSETPIPAMVELGLVRFWDQYFAGRAAPLGLAPAEVVHAVLYNFAPGEVARHIPGVWQITTPEAAYAARLQGCVERLGLIWGAHPPSLARAADLATQVATSAPTEGRPLFAGLRALPVPTEPIARLVHATTVLREHRGEGHIAALVSAGIGGLECHALHALSVGMPVEEFDRLHHLPQPMLDAVVEGMRGRGLVDAEGRLSDHGRDVKDRIESLTDELAAPPYDALGPGGLDELIGELEPLSAAVAAA